jgi:REP element-mobilizing transposase RayT
MILNDFGRIADDEWQDLTIRFMHIELDAYVVMPNHMHGIIFINSITPEVKNLATNTAVLNQITGKTENTGAQVACVNRASTIGNMISAYKSLVVNKCLDKFKIIYPDQLMGNIWHSGYYENIIRNEQAYANISNYIRENPANWKGDKFFRDDD